MYLTQERRAKPRVDVDCAAIVEGINGDGGKYSLEGRLVNLSASGLFMLINRDIENGTKLSITFCLSDSLKDMSAPKVATCGTIVRKEPVQEGTYGVAIKFYKYRFL